MQVSQQQALEKSTIRLALQQQEQQKRGTDEDRAIHLAKVIGAGLIFVGILYLISLIIYQILQMIDAYIIIACILTAWYFIWAVLASLGFFIGQFWFVKRPILNGINNFFPFQDNFHQLKYIIEYINKPNFQADASLEESWGKARQAIQLGTCLKNLRKGDEKNLTPNQNIIYDEMIFVIDALQKVPCSDKQNQTSFGTLHDLIMDDKRYDQLKQIQMTNNFIKYEIQEDFLDSQLLPKMQSVIESIHFCQQINSDKHLDYFFKYDPLINFKLYHEFMRYYQNAEFFTVLGQDKKKIDCVYIPTPLKSAKNQAKSGGISAFQKVFGGEDAIMIILNKNSCYWEQEAFGKQVKFYLSKGISVVSMNYRGYGDSEGIPWIKDIEEDGENFVRYVREKYKPKKLGVNGWSMGGMFSTHLANKCNLDFLLADRTFSKPCEAARFLLENRQFISTYFPYLGKFSKFLLQNLPFQNWGKNSGRNFVQFRGAKMLSYDPKDEIIPFPASLLNSVTNELFDLHFKTQYETGIKRMFLFDENRIRLETIGLAKSQMKIVFSEFEFVYNLIDILQKKGGGDRVDIELKNIFDIIKIDKMSLYDIMTKFEDNQKKVVFKQFLVNIVVQNCILIPGSLTTSLNYFMQELDSFNEKIQDFNTDTSVKFRLQGKTMPAFKDCFIKLNNASMQSCLTDESPPEIKDHQTRIMRVDLGHNTDFADEHFAALEQYLYEVDFISNKNNLNNA